MRRRKVAVQRSTVIVLALVAVGAIYFELIHGTPSAILYSALVTGMLNALVAAALILVYRTIRVFNFAQTALGAAGAELTFQLLVLTKTPFWIAFPAGLLLAAALGTVFELAVARRFFRAPRLVLTVATIASAELLGILGPRLISNLPIFPRNRSLLADLGTLSIRDRLPFPGFHYHVGALPLVFGAPELLALEVSAAALLVVAAFFRFTRAGIAVRAMAENTDRAALLGISVGSLSLIVWTLAGLLSGAGVIMTGAVTVPGAAQGIAPGVLFPGLAAAVLARMRSLPIAVAASVVIALFSGAFSYDFPRDKSLVSFGLFLIIGVGLLAQRRSLQRGEDEGSGSWEASGEQRAVPRELRALAPVRVARYSLIAAVVAGLGIYPFLASAGLTNLGGVIALDAIAGLSLVVLTGWAGQVSLGQFGFVGVGAVVGGSLMSRVGLPFWLAVPLTSLFTAVFAAAVGIPALRIRGLFLAVSTFAFAIAVHDVLFDPRYFSWLLPADVKRPSLFFINFQDERSTYFLCVAAFLGTAVVLANLRRSRFGRILVAARENEPNLQAFGVDVLRTKLQAFAWSGAICGFGGALFAIQARGVSAGSFDVQRSIDLFLLAVLGGIASAPGILLGLLYFDVSRYFLQGNIAYRSIEPFAVLCLLYAAPGGLISLVNRVRDALLRIVAQRRQIIVPSLFADLDPEALEHRLIPLAEAGGGGLAAMPSTDRWALASEVHGPSAKVHAPDGRRSARDAAAIGAAVEASAGVSERGGG